MKTALYIFICLLFFACQSKEDREKIRKLEYEQGKLKLQLENQEEQKEITQRTVTDKNTDENFEEEKAQFNVYCNNRFDFCIHYPDKLIPQGESDNGDGQFFTSNDGKSSLAVYRSFRNLDGNGIDFKREFESDQQLYSKVTYKKYAKDFFVISGFNEIGNIFYEKSILKNGEFITSVLIYPQSERKYFDKASEKIFKTFK